LRPPAGPGPSAPLAAAVLVAIATLAPWALGATTPAALIGVTLVALVASALALGLGAARGDLVLPSLPLWPLTGFLALAAVQLVPLPHALHRWLAPGSHAVWHPADPHLVHADAELVVENQHFASGHQSVVHVDINRIARELVEFDYAAFAEFQHILDEHLASSQLDFHVEFDISEKIDAAGLCVRHRSLKFGQIERNRIRCSVDRRGINGSRLFARKRFCAFKSGGVQQRVDVIHLRRGILDLRHRLRFRRLRGVHLIQQRVNVRRADAGVGGVLVGWFGVTV